MSSRSLGLDDIADLRAYERDRVELRKRVIGLKRLRRVAVGPVVTLVFENRETMRFQVQEMARAERISTDAKLQAELDVYNALIPGPGELSATLFVELRSPEELEEWLPKLVGIERSVVLHLGGVAGLGDEGPGGEGPGRETIRAAVEEGHDSQLTRDDVTASVHYIRFRLDEGQVERFAAGPAALGVDHPAYRHTAELDEAVRAELLSDLRD